MSLTHLDTVCFFYVMLIPQQHTPGAFPYLLGSACFVRYQYCHCYLDMAPQDQSVGGESCTVVGCKIASLLCFLFSDMKRGRSEWYFGGFS